VRLKWIGGKERPKWLPILPYQGERAEKENAINGKEPPISIHLLDNKVGTRIFDVSLMLVINIGCWPGQKGPFRGRGEI
jgi:hypothetical protein